MNEPVTILMDLPTTVKGFCCHAQDGSDLIVINSRMPQEVQRRTYQHECEHIRAGQMDDPHYVEYK